MSRVMPGARAGVPGAAWSSTSSVNVDLPASVGVHVEELERVEPEPVGRDPVVVERLQHDVQRRRLEAARRREPRTRTWALCPAYTQIGARCARHAAATYASAVDRERRARAWEDLEEHGGGDTAWCEGPGADRDRVVADVEHVPRAGP